jgi:hypothetical protein
LISRESAPANGRDPIGLGTFEATGLTDLRGTVIRQVSPAGTIVIEVDDPAAARPVLAEPHRLAKLRQQQVERPQAMKARGAVSAGEVQGQVLFLVYRLPSFSHSAGLS